MTVEIKKGDRVKATIKAGDGTDMHIEGPVLALAEGACQVQTSRGYDVWLSTDSVSLVSSS